MTKKQMLGYLSKVQRIQRESNVKYFYVSTHREKDMMFICVDIQKVNNYESFKFYDFRTKEENDETLKDLIKCASGNG